MRRAICLLSVAGWRFDSLLGSSLALLFDQFSARPQGDAEIGHFDIEISGQQHVAGLQVPMDDSDFVNCRYP